MTKNNKRHTHPWPFMSPLHAQQPADFADRSFARKPNQTPDEWAAQYLNAPSPRAGEAALEAVARDLTHTKT